MRRLLAHHRDSDPVAFGGAGVRTRADLLRDAQAVAERLPGATDSSEVLLVFQADRYHFAVALLGAWIRGHAVALPPNTRRDSVVALRDRASTVMVLHDTAAGIPLRIDDEFLAGVAPARPEVGSLAALGRMRDTVAVVHTSGSTGQARPSFKSQEALFAEAAVLAKLFGIAVGDKIVGTVPPGHLYGFLLTVLVPLVSGAAFSRTTPHFAESIAALVEHERATLLATVPVHLRGLSSTEVGRLKSLRLAISSAAPLPEETARGFERRHEVPVMEIFGSTETGGMATRRLSAAPRWTPLPGVVVTQSSGGELCVASPFLGKGTKQPLVTADLIALHPDGTFEHQGRADGVVKVGGERVNLAAMEDRIASVPGVRDAVVLSTGDAGGHGQQVLAAIVGDDVTDAALRESLLLAFSASSLPRKMIRVAALPREDSGKLQRKQALRLFGLCEDGAPVNYELTWSNVPSTGAEEAEGKRTFHAIVPTDYGFFDGHFPGVPILPGAAQMSEIVLPALRRAWPGLGMLTRVTKLKFTGRIGPGDTIAVVLSRSPQSPHHVDFVIRKQATACASGVLEFSALAPHASHEA